MPSILETLLANIKPCRTFNQMLSMEWRRLMLERNITRVQFAKLVDDYMLTKPKVTRSMMRAKLLERLTGDSMTVKSFRAGLRVLGIDDYPVMISLHIRAEGLPYPKQDTARETYFISDDAR